MLKKIRYPIFFKTRNVFYFSQNEPKSGGKQTQEEIKQKPEIKSEGPSTFQDRLEKRLRVFFFVISISFFFLFKGNI